jgi:O-antigen/teichoic acid export membrane protein
MRLFTHLKKVLGPLGWGAILTFLACRCSDIATILCRFFLGSMLPTKDFGAIDPVLAVLAVTGLPIAVVFQIAVKSISRFEAIGKTEQTRSLIRDLATMCTIASIAVILLVFGMSEFILERLHLDSHVYIYLIAALFAASWWYAFYFSIVQGLCNYRVLLVSGITNGGLLLGLTLLLIGPLAFGLKGALLARIGASIVVTLLALAMMRKTIFGPRASYAEEFPVIRGMVIPMSIYFLSTTLLLNMDRLLVRNFLLEHSGGYGAIVTLGSIPLYLLGGLVFVMFPIASAEHVKGQDLARFYAQALGFGLAITLVCAIGFSLVAEPIMRMWNKEFEPYARYLWLYALAMGLHGTIQTVANVEMARHRYAFLWFVLVPAVAMCVFLYAGRSTATVKWVLEVLVATHAVVLALVLLCGWRTSNRIADTAS